MVRSNPFADFGTTVTGDRFIGREAELRRVESRVFGTKGFGSIAVIGLPRIGKTSLVSEAVRRAEPRAAELRSVVVQTNVGAFTSVNGLFRSLIEELIDGIRRHGFGSELIETRTAQALATPLIGFNEVRSVFRAIRQAEVRPICVLEEFDAGRRVFEDTPQCFHWLRELCSNPEFKAAIVLVAKRRLQDVARLAGYESNYWSNVIDTLYLKIWSDEDVACFFSHLGECGVPVGEAERSEVLVQCGGHPFLLDGFAYHAWEHMERGRNLDVDSIRDAYRTLVREYLPQVTTVLGDGPLLSKAVQVFVGPQWDVTSEERKRSVRPRHRARGWRHITRLLANVRGPHPAYRT
jgi:hypothetical protein